jgi:hypothetical protein
MKPLEGEVSWTAHLPIPASRKLMRQSSTGHETGTHPRVKPEGMLFRIML